MKLLEAWANCQVDSPPFLLDGDQRLLNSERSKRAIVTHDSWRDAFQDPEFCPPGDTRLHLGLLPMPYFGDLLNASVYLLMLNPGVGPDDYYGEWAVPACTAALVTTLKQQPHVGGTPFIWLDPQFQWHGGFRYWHGRKLAKIIQCLAETWGVSPAKARCHVGSLTACLQLLPYHSLAFKDADGWLRLRKLRSVDLARSFAAEYVFPRVQSGQAIAVVMRAVAAWDLPEHPGVVRYGAGESLGAHLTPNSRGGSAILKHLSDRRPTMR